MVALVAASAAVRAETRPRYGRKLAGSLLGKPVTLDPVQARTHAEVQLASLLFDTLYLVAEDGRAMPHVAAAPPVYSKDGKQARVALRDAVQFHDGSVLGADDVVASLERAMKSGQAAWATAPIASVARSGAGEILFTLRRPTPELAELLALPSAAITPGGRAPGKKPIGSGPFKLDRAGRGQLALLPWDDHFAGRPYVDRLDLRWFDSKSGEARAYEVGDLLLSARGAVAFTGHKPKYPTEVTAGPATVLVYVGFGKQHGGAFGNADLRAALSLAIARDGMRHIGTGERVSPTRSPISTDLGGREPETAELAAQPAEASTALALAAGAVAALSARPKPTWEILVDRTRPDDREIAEKVAAGLYRLGQSGRVVELDPDGFAGRVARGECDLYVGQLAAVAPSPALQIAAAFATGGDAWAEQALAAGPLDVDAGLRAFAERLPIVPLYHRAIRMHHRVDVRRIEFDPCGRLRYADMFLFGGYEGKP